MGLSINLSRDEFIRARYLYFHESNARIFLQTFVSIFLPRDLEAILEINFRTTVHRSIELF